MKLYLAAKNDSEFLEAIRLPCGIKPPTENDKDLDKIMFAAIYFGYQIGKFGTARLV